MKMEVIYTSCEIIIIILAKMEAIYISCENKLIAFAG